MPALITSRLPRSTESILEDAKLNARRGHPSLSNYNKFAKLFSTFALEFDSIALCPTCSVSKEVMHKSKLSSTGYPSPLQLLSADLGDPFRYEDFDPNPHFMTTRDTYSRYYIVLHLKAKSDAVKELIQWITNTERVFSSREGYKIGAIRTDNGTEFVNQTLHACITERGNTHQLTVPYNNFQNGAVE